jgi:hypothetical protein
LNRLGRIDVGVSLGQASAPRAAARTDPAPGGA